MKNKPAKVSSRKENVYNFDRDYERHYWLIIPILTIIYFGFSFFSKGFYQDDEIAHYVNMRDFWSNPGIIMSNWGKPGWKILLVLPSLGGVPFVLFFNSLISALTVYFSVKLAKLLNFKNTILAGAFIAFQPLFYQLSFRSYAEIYTGLLLVLCLYFYYRKNYNLSALMCGLSFTARQETALIGLVLAYFFIREKQWFAIIMLGVFPFIMNMIGYFMTGDPVWVISEMKGLGELNMGVDRSFFHYFKVYIYIIGPVVFTYFIIGFVKPFINKSERKVLFNHYGLVYAFFLILFLFQCYLVAKGTNPGSWRYLLQASPFAGLIALVGFDETIKMKQLKYVFPALLTLLVSSFLFFMKEPTGLDITDNPYYFNVIIILLITGISYFILTLSEAPNFRLYLIAILILTAIFTFYTEKPREQSPENAALQDMAQWYLNNADKSKEVLYNHQLLIYYGNIFGEQKKKFITLNMKTLDESPKGSIIIWDNHYSYRPEYKNDTKFDYLKNNPDKFKLLNQFSSSDNRFHSFIFEKL